MHRFASFVIALLASASACAHPRDTLNIYLFDVEGGNATLFVAPSGESLLIDTGNGGPAAERDAGRILDAAADAGVRRIDHLITTHYHGDHFGAMETLAARIPIAEFIGHGANVQPGAGADAFLAAYPKLYAKASHVVAKPGDRVKLGDVDVRIVASAGEAIRDSLPGAGQANPFCASYVAKDPDPSENAQ